MSMDTFSGSDFSMDLSSSPEKSVSCLLVLQPYLKKLPFFPFIFMIQLQWQVARQTDDILVNALCLWESRNDLGLSDFSYQQDDFWFRMFSKSGRTKEERFCCVPFCLKGSSGTDTDENLGTDCGVLVFVGLFLLLPGYGRWRGVALHCYPRASATHVP